MFFAWSLRNLKSFSCHPHIPKLETELFPPHPPLRGIFFPFRCLLFQSFPSPLFHKFGWDTLKDGQSISVTVCCKCCSLKRTLLVGLAKKRIGVVIACAEPSNCPRSKCTTVFVLFIFFGFQMDLLMPPDPSVLLVLSHGTVATNWFMFDPTLKLVYQLDIGQYRNPFGLIRIHQRWYVTKLKSG